MSYTIVGIVVVALGCTLFSLRRIAPLQMELFEQIGSQRLYRLGMLILIAPLLVIFVVVLLYFLIWQSDPRLRFAHMLWVLGLWMLGTLGLFSFILPARTKLAYPYLALLASLFSIALAIYFTPLPTFTTIFQSQPGLVLPAAIGCVNIALSWSIAYRIRANRFASTQAE